MKNIKMKMNINEAKQILNRSGYLLEDYGGYKKEKRVKFSYLYCLLKSKGVDMMLDAGDAVKSCSINFTLDDVDVYIANDKFGSPYRGTNESDDTVYLSVLLNDEDGTSREKEVDLDTIISFVEKGNLNKIKEIAQEIKNDESIDVDGADYT